MDATAAAEVYNGVGFGYDPILEAAEYGITIKVDPTAADTGEYDPITSTIKVRSNERTHYRSTATVQLCYAITRMSTVADAVEFACARLIAYDDLVALALATPDRHLWARALHVRTCLLDAYLQTKHGLPVSV